MQKVVDLQAQFGVQNGQPWLLQSNAVLDDCTVVLCTGLVLYSLRTASDKAAFRDGVAKGLAVLKTRCLAKEVLVPALRVRAEQALVFKVPLAST